MCIDYLQLQKKQIYKLMQIYKYSLQIEEICEAKKNVINKNLLITFFQNKNVILFLIFTFDSRLGIGINSAC